MRLLGLVLLTLAATGWEPSPVSGGPVTLEVMDVGILGPGSPSADYGKSIYRGASQFSSSGTPIRRFDSSAPVSFFSDVFRAPSSVRLTCTGCEDPHTATPHPVSLLLFGAILAGVGVIVRRRLRRPVASNSA